MPLQQDIWDNENLIKILKENGIAVMPTDTLYGIVGAARSADTVNRIYDLRKRAPNKPCIVLIGEIGELENLLGILVISRAPAVTAPPNSIAGFVSIRAIPPLI